MRDAAFKEADRAQMSFLAPLEKRCLVWLAGHTPAWINPDHLSALGLAAMLGAGLSYWYARYNKAGLILVIVCLAFNWLGDSLDGTLARVRNKQRPKYGFYVDHIIDAIGTFFLLAGLALSGYMSERIAAGLLVVYFLLTIEVYLATYTIGTFHLSFWKFSPTELRILLMIGNLALIALADGAGLRRAVSALRYRRTGGHYRDEPDVHRGGRAPHDRALSRRARLMRLVLNAGKLRQLGRRWLKFHAVGVIGVAVQLAALAFFKSVLGLHYMTATALAVEAAVLHNFWWHERWTWVERTRQAPGVVLLMGRLLRFNVSSGLLSIVSNLVLMRLFVGHFHLHYLVANILTIVTASLANFLLSELLVFRVQRH